MLKARGFVGTIIMKLLKSQTKDLAVGSTDCFVTGRWKNGRGIVMRLSKRLIADERVIS